MIDFRFHQESIHFTPNSRRMGCTQSTNTTTGPKIHPEHPKVVNNTSTNAGTPVEARPATTTNLNDDTAISTTTTKTIPPSDLEIAAKAQQEELLRAKSDQERQHRVALFRATKDGDVEAVQQALINGANVNSIGMWDNTPLICACQYGFDQVAGILIEAECNVNAVNEKGCTALHHAAIEGLSEVVQRLLQKGAKPNVKPAKLYNPKIDKNEMLDPLQAATAVGDIESVRVLAIALGEISERVSNSETAEDAVVDDTVNSVSEQQALKLAIQRGTTLAILPVLELCTKRTKNNTLDGLVLLKQACDSKNEAITMVLLEGLQTFKMIENEQSFEIMNKACENEMALVLKNLLDNGAVVDEETVAIAQKSNNPAIMALLPANPQ